jgi:hypothetical protein
MNDQRITPQLMLAFVPTCVLPVFLAWDLLPALWGRGPGAGAQFGTGLRMAL